MRLSCEIQLPISFSLFSTLYAPEQMTDPFKALKRFAGTSSFYQGDSMMSWKVFAMPVILILQKISAVLYR